MTCFEQAAPHGGVLCSQQFRNALVAGGERLTNYPTAAAASATAATRRASAAGAAASDAATSTGAAGLVHILSLGFIGAPSSPRAVAGPQDAALCPVVRHSSPSSATPPCQDGGDVALPSSSRPATPSGQAFVDLDPVTSTAHASELEGEADRGVEFSWPSFTSSRFVSGAFSALATPLLPALLGSPAPALASRSPSFESLKVLFGDVGAAVGPFCHWRPLRTMRPTLDAHTAPTEVNFSSPVPPEVRGPLLYSPALFFPLYFTSAFSLGDFATLVCARNFLRGAAGCIYELPCFLRPVPQRSLDRLDILPP